MALTPGCARDPGTSEMPALRIAVGGQAQFIYLPLTLAQQLGYYEEQGLGVEIADLKGGSEALAALVGGSVDVVCGFYEHTIRAQSQGKHLVMVVLFDLRPGMVLMLGKTHLNQVRSIRDLAGRPVGVTAPGSTTDAMLKYLLQQNGLHPQAIPAVTAGTTTMIAAIEQDRVWAGITVDPVASKLSRDGTARPLYDTRTEEGTREVFGGPWPAGGLYTTVDFLEKNPRTVQALVNAAVKTLKFIRSHSAPEIASRMPEPFLAGDPDLYVASLEANLGMFSPDGLMPADGPANVLKTLGVLDPQITPDRIALEQTYDNGYAEKAR